MGSEFESILNRFFYSAGGNFANGASKSSDNSASSNPLYFSNSSHWIDVYSGQKFQHVGRRPTYLFQSAQVDSTPIKKQPRLLNEGQQKALKQFIDLGATFLDECFTDLELKKAYRVLVKKTHPDLNPKMDGSLFRQVREAFKALRFS